MAENSGGLTGSYDIVDTFILGTGLTLTNATLIYGGESDGADGTILSPFSSGDQIITGESLAGLRTESWIITAIFTIDRDLFDPTQDCANGGGYGNQIAMPGDTDTSNNTACVPVRIGAVEITKDGIYVDSDLNGLTNANDTINYTFSVTNAGNVAISNVVVSDALLGGTIAGPMSGDTDGDGALDLSETWTFTASYTLIQTDIDNGQVNNLATVTGEDPDRTTVTDTSTDPTPCTSCIVDPSCPDCTLTELPNNSVDITLAKFADSNSARIGDQVNFTITALNSGSVAASNITISEILPNGFDYIEHATIFGSYDETNGLWNIATLNAGEEAELSISVFVVEGTDYVNTVRLFDLDQPDTDPSNDEASIEIQIEEPICTIFVYNSFSTNGDGTNEFFHIECIENYPNNYVEIFNRWGIKVFEKRNYDNSWNGVSYGRSTYKANEALPVGTYYYVLDLGDGSKSRAGWVYLTR